MTVVFRGHPTGVLKPGSKLFRRACMEAMQSWRVERCSLPLGGLISVADFDVSVRSNDSPTLAH